MSTDKSKMNQHTENQENEHYDRINATLRASSILTSASGVMFGFLLNIVINTPPSFTLFEDVVILASLYALTIASALFIIPVVFHQANYKVFNSETFLAKSRMYLLRGTIWFIVGMYFGLALALSSNLPNWVAAILAFLLLFLLFIISGRLGCSRKVN